MTISAIRELAKSKIKNRRLILMVGFILPFVLWTTIIQLFFSIFGVEDVFSIFDLFINGWSGFTWEYLLLPILLVLLYIVGDVFSINYRWLGIEFLQSKELEVNDIFQVLKKDKMRAVLSLVVLRGVIVLLWSLLFIVPGIWKAYLYSQAENNMKLNPELSPMDALKKSEEQMKGYIYEYILLQLSFSAWYLVPIGLYSFFLMSNWRDIQIAFETGIEVVDLALGIVVIMSLIFGMILLICALYVEPYKLISKQIFYRELLTMDKEE